ncbi:flagellar hook protein FlgE [Pseudoroseomonas cervicalis]|uniref:flagellar hook protein FlgE n=1 Tax=Teichococcus cervicalis TaxID=204525 RepID=UPI0027867CC7|nr:flagellar hook-basal body complex protein [Pseudoroseomonas cervicalis]MDQ1079547.1 flagellar hook protein FlgE [Pseudoroseomonas cervicalis]
MSLNGSLYAATSGLGAQTAAITNVSNNVANSQTTGYKRVDTSFAEQLSQSTTRLNGSSTVSAAPVATVSRGGDISQVENPLAMAISGNGLFAVSRPAGTDANGNTVYSPTQYYTRNGDFSKNAEGYLVNTSGYALEGWPVANGAVNRGQLGLIQVDESPFPPQMTDTVSVSANLPASGTETSYSTQVPIYDNLGIARSMTLTWTRQEGNQWQVNLQGPDGASAGTALVTFSDGSGGGNGMPSGTIDSISNTTGSLSASAFSGQGSLAGLTVTNLFGAGSGNLALSLGTYGSNQGVTQYAGTTYQQNTVTANGAAPGAYTGVSVKENGEVVVSYDNGKSRTIAQVPIVTFQNADGLQREDGQAFTATQEAGLSRVLAAGEQGTGSLATSSIEASNVDITSEFSKMIIAQRAYSANSRVLSTVSGLLSETVDMLR